MEQLYTFDQLSIIATLMHRYHYTAEQAAELAADILN